MGGEGTKQFEWLRGKFDAAVPMYIQSRYEIDPLFEAGKRAKRRPWVPTVRRKRKRKGNQKKKK